MPAAPLPRFERDLFSEQGILNSHDYHRQIRGLGPVVEYAMYDCHAVGRYDDVRRVLRDDKTFISGEGIALGAAMNEKMNGAIITSDSPRNEFLRKLQGQPLTPGAVSELTDLVVGEAEGLFSRIMSGSLDAMTTIAQYLPVTIVSGLVGLPARNFRWRASLTAPEMSDGSLESPIRAFTRLVAHAEIAGVSVPKGARLPVLYGSANRDERRWENAERFKVASSNARGQLAFGFGRHTCLGAHLAKLEMQSIRKAMVTRVESFAIGDPVFVLNNILRGPQHLPMTLH